ncbi:uncharacterized [Tachysurus ichikawai]
MVVMKAARHQRSPNDKRTHGTVKYSPLLQRRGEKTIKGPGLKKTVEGIETGEESKRQREGCVKGGELIIMYE